MRLAQWDGSPDMPDGWPGMVPVVPGDPDGDGDGVPDTVVVARAAGGVWVFTDTDCDGFADRVLDVQPGLPEDPEPVGVLDALVRLVTGREP